MRKGGPGREELVRAGMPADPPQPPNHGWNFSPAPPSYGNSSAASWISCAAPCHSSIAAEFPLQFDIHVAYPQVASKIELAALDGKMYRSVQFKPMWAKNFPSDSGMLKHKGDEAAHADAVLLSYRKIQYGCQ